MWVDLSTQTSLPDPAHSTLNRALSQLQAKWALDFHKISFKNTDYTPGVGERWLRRKTGKATGLITVPVMFTPEGTLRRYSDIF